MHDVIIVGAGPSGLCAAKTILQVEPQLDLKIIDAQQTVGGVWAREKLYAGLKTNNLRPGLDFSDFPMPDSLGIKMGEHITGKAMHEFLEMYAERWRLTEKIDFGVRVVETSRLDSDNGWQLTTRRGESNTTEVISCRKLVVAIGSTNAPHRPRIAGIEQFDAPVFHSSEIGPNAEVFRDREDIGTIAVLGGGKSAYDAVYLAAMSGKKVEWIIRKSGKGPAWIFPAYTKIGPFNVWRERLTTRRLVSFMSPCIWNDGFKWARHFLHFTDFGKGIAQKFWQNIHKATLRDCDYVRHEKLHVLEPETSPFWYGTASGVNSYDTDFYSFIINGKVRVHREDVDHLTSKSIHLGNGEDLQADALVTATGFSAKPTMNFTPSARPECTHSDLGIPTAGLRGRERAMWADLDIVSDERIAEHFPRLVAGPHLSPTSGTLKPYNAGSSSAREAKYSPWRLYRCIAPPGLTARGDRSLVFIGMFSNLATNMRMELQCVWAAAYLFGRIPKVEEDVRSGHIFQEVSFTQRYTQLRAPFGHGRFYPDLVFDQVPYCDMLLQDLGLESKRKSGWTNGVLGWLGLREIFEPYTIQDYRGVVGEWLAKNWKR